MKRSDMVSLMVSKYAETFRGSMSEMDDQERMERILQAMEDAGIKPPVWDNYNPTQSEKTFSSDGDWTYHREKDGKRIYSLACDYWEEE